MFSLKEQLFLLELLKADRQGGIFRVKSSFHYNTMENLCLNEYVYVVSNKPKIYGLTIIGECLASLIAKHNKTDPKFLKFAGTVDMAIYK